jgi:hypothetical protein
MTIEFPRRTGRVAQRPEMFSEWAKRFPQTSESIAAAVKGLVDGYKGVVETHERIGRDESATQGFRIVRSARNAKAKLTPLLDALDAAAGQSKAHADQLRGKLRAAYRPPAPSVHEFLLGQEIRQHFKKMDPARIAQELEAAKEAGDLETLSAVAAYAPYLSGLPAKVHEWARSALIEARAPQEAAMLSQLEEQVGYAEQFRAEMLSSVSEMIDFARASQI